MLRNSSSAGGWSMIVKVEVEGVNIRKPAKLPVAVYKGLYTPRTSTREPINEVKLWMELLSENQTSRRFGPANNSS